MQNSITFFCDASYEMGLGHYSRCKNFALAIDAHKNGTATICFAGEFRKLVKDELKALNWSYIDCDLNSIASLKNQFGAVSIEGIAVIDSYIISNDAIQYIAKTFKRSVFIDDFNRHDFSLIDAVINFRFNYDTSSYNVKNGLFGLDYFPALAEMVALRENTLKQKNITATKDISSILLYLGALSPAIKQQTINVIDELLNNVTITVLSGLDDMPDHLTSSSNIITVKPLTFSLSKSFEDVDVVICSGGLIKYEAGFCLTPNASINQTQDQHDDTVVLAVADLTFDFGVEKDLINNNSKFLEKMRQFFSIETRQKQMMAMKSLYDIGSTHKAALAILNDYNG